MASRSNTVHIVRFAALGGMFFAGCAAGDARFTPDELAGFWFGLWHGLIACATFVIGLFYDSVEIYERANNGAWYDLGFLIGVTLFGGSGHHTHKRWRCRNTDRTEITADTGSGRINVDITWTADDPARPAPDVRDSSD